MDLNVVFIRFLAASALAMAVRGNREFDIETWNSAYKLHIIIRGTSLTYITAIEYEREQMRILWR
jgi:hypothetical protein